MKERGFTLMETLVYLALFAVVMSGLFASVYALAVSADHAKTVALLQEEKEFLIAAIERAVRGASSVALLSSHELVSAAYDGATDTISLAGDDLEMNGAPLNDGDVRVSDLVFTHGYAGGANPEWIDAGFAMEIRAPDGRIFTEHASTTVYLRK